MEPQNEGIRALKRTADLARSSAIYESIGKKKNFSSLNRSEQMMVLLYISSNGLSTRFFHYKGYDILKRRFFAEEYGCDPGNMFYEPVIRNIEFETFDELFKYTGGDVRENCCYFGFNFSDELRHKYNIGLQSEPLTRKAFTYDKAGDASLRAYMKTLSVSKWPKGKLTYSIKKEFKNGKFSVTEIWAEKDKEVFYRVHRFFVYICDFIFYLDGDLSNADLIGCDGLENLSHLPGIKLNSAKIQSSVSRAFGIKTPALKYVISTRPENESSIKNELATAKIFLAEIDPEDYGETTIAYATDVHLPEHISHLGITSQADASTFLLDTARKFIGEFGQINVIGGDISNNFQIYTDFVHDLRAEIGDISLRQLTIFTLGNHEFWSFPDKSIDEVVAKYKFLLKRNGFHLLHNNAYLFYRSFFPREITEDEIKNATIEELRKKIWVGQSPSFIVFGGVGFSKLKEGDAAYFGPAVSREACAAEAKKFSTLYEKIVEAFRGMNVIVVTHMPFEYWSDRAEKENGFTYIWGHNHKNERSNSENCRVYADGQIGYNQPIGMKRFYADGTRDIFAGYKDGIWEISKRDYYLFYDGIGQSCYLGKDFEKLYMLKRNGNYMFLIQEKDRGNLKGKLYYLSGGNIRKTNGHSVEYYYENLKCYADSVKMFLSEYSQKQKELALAIKNIGGNGKIHGAIIDVDGENLTIASNHIYLNPLDGTVTPYFAFSMTNKHVYKNVPSLLKSRCPEMFKRYLIEAKGSSASNPLTPLSSEQDLSDETVFIEETDMYKISRILKKLQSLSGHNVVKIWNDQFLEETSAENGRLLLENLLA